MKVFGVRCGSGGTSGASKECHVEQPSQRRVDPIDKLHGVCGSSREERRGGEEERRRRGEEQREERRGGVLLTAV
jgi:hypothetical protein